MKKYVLLVTTFLDKVWSEAFDLIRAIVHNGLTYKFYFLNWHCSRHVYYVYQWNDNFQKTFTAVWFQWRKLRDAIQSTNSCNYFKVWFPRLMHRNWHINSHCLYQWKWLTRLVSRLKNRSRSSREIISKRSSANASGRSSNLSSRPSTQLLSKKTSLRSATTNRVLSFGSFWSIVPLSNSLPRNFLEAW